MYWLRSCIFRVAFICVALTSCATFFSRGEPTPVYDVRNVVVLAGPNIPAAVLAGVGDRVNKAINATVRTEVYPRVVLTIRVLSVQNDQGYDKKHSVAKVTVDAASVDDGTVIAVSSFEVNSKSNSADASDEILAEDISARIRSIFSLSAGHA
ncbi:hypothetical protein ASC97_05255 [Rhizobium sp. Root1203]|uniref:hypothetical protein n=1 Tax=Rhizobium sp. Root1203 TaxID=1736427 RepID=UPI000708E2BA|nr:hypothetical protein [Rhizobium sp. Root1203]KQV27783.1 hypothetical protein ASC97_05255 [Rhizobium sp. Root1203]